MCPPMRVPIYMFSIGEVIFKFCPIPVHSVLRRIKAGQIESKFLYHNLWNIGGVQSNY